MMSERGLEISGGSVLVLRGDASLVRRVREALQPAGFAVTAVSASAPGADLRRSGANIVVLGVALDEGLDEVRGLADQIRESSIPSILIVTARPSSDLQRLREIGLGNCLLEPFTSSQLRASIESALGQHGYGCEDCQYGGARGRLEHLEVGLASALGVLREAGLLARTNGAPTVSPSLLVLLSPREREVLELLLDHKRPKTIATALGISPSTVRNHLKSMFVKVGVSSQEELLDRLLSGDA